ncbi:hypothetical protein U9M48_029487 [Paspalum notatum var. saurae]|uniref:Ionotropic glutamate receptor C-terminal domain-containing protein n=1 Tax=Paspalum notatum var. saurae TaxID=547442 RepID=A0AAQ3TXZ2_PASNO
MAAALPVRRRRRFAHPARASGRGGRDGAGQNRGGTSVSMAREAYKYEDPLQISDASGDVATQDDTEGLYGRELARKNSGGCEKKLRIAVPHKHGFKAFVNVTHPNTKMQKVTGYSIEIFEEAMKMLQPRPHYEFYVFNGSYDELVHSVSLKVFDAAVGDVTITPERIRDADFKMPYAQSGLSLLMLSKDDSKPIQWIFLEPLTKELWFATVSGFLFTGFVVWMIEQPTNPEYQGSRLRQFSTASYFAFSTLTFSHDQIIRSPLSKIVVVVWCFAVLVVVQSYTANLSSMLTAKRLRPLVTDLNQLLHNGDHVGYQGGGFTCSFLIKQGFPLNRIKAYSDQAEYAEALRKGSKNGGVSAILDEIPYLTYFLSNPQYKKEFQMVNRMYKTLGLGFVFPLGSPLVHNLSIAILNLTGEYEGPQIEERWLGPAASPVGDGAITVFTALPLRSFSGLFIITGCISTLMLVISIGKLLYVKYYNSDRDSGSICVGESIVPQTDMGGGYVPDTLLHEIGDNDSQDASGSDGSPGDIEAAGPTQNGVYNGSVPADHLQIEMSTAGQRVGTAL